MKKPSNKSISHQSQFTRIIIDLERFKKALDFKNNHGVCGSINLGNTCFMNSSIACLSNCSELTYYFLTQEFKNHINKKNVNGTKGELPEKWYNLLEEYWLTYEKYGNPKKIKNIVGSKYKKFLGFNQQDSNEFMTVFLDLLGEDLNSATKKVYRELYEQRRNETDIQAAKRFWSLHIERNDSIITDLFHGLLKCIITCPKCNFKNITYDPFNTLTLTIPSINKIYEFQQKQKIRKKKSLNALEKKQKKEKINVNIYYVSPFSLIPTKKFEIEVYKGSYLTEIIKEIQNRSDKVRIQTNLIFASISNRELERFLDPKKLISNVNFIFAYEKENKGKYHYNIPIYLCDNKKTSAYPRLLFFNNNVSYNDFKKKIYILVRKYINSPFWDKTKREEFMEDKELNNYIEGNSNKLDRISELLENEFILVQKNVPNTREFKNNSPYQIILKKDFNSQDEYLINEGNYDNGRLLADFGINSENDSIDYLLNFLNNNERNKLYLFVKINNNSPFTKKDISFDHCFVEKCSPLKEEKIEEEMEIDEEEEDEEDEYINSDRITLHHCIQYFTEEESLEAGNEWYCNKCQRRVRAKKQIELFYLPRIMIICLSRFLKKGKFYDYTKNNSFVDFPIENLNMEKYVCGPDKKYSKYDLFAVSQHYGGMGGGHYTAICKNIDGEWYEYDDQSCTRASKRDICTNAAYVLFYRRKNW